MKIGLVGAGGIASMHVRSYSYISSIELVAVAEPSPTMGDIMKENHPSIHVYSCIQDMITHEKLDMIDICSPSYLHADQAILVMEQGIPVLCEKPIALNSSDIVRINETIKRTECIFMAAQVIRFWPEYAYLKEVFDKKTFGTLLQLRMSRSGQMPSPNHWMRDVSKSGGVLIDLHIHDIDFIQYILGKPKSVRTIGTKNKTCIDYISTILDYDMVIVESSSSWYTASVPFTMSYLAVFESAVLEYGKDGLILYEPNVLPIHVAIGQDLKADVNLNINTLSPYINEISYFIDCIKSNRHPSIIKPEESLSCMRILEAEAESLRTGEEVAVE